MTVRFSFGNPPPNLCLFSVGNHQVAQFDYNMILQLHSSGQDPKLKLKTMLLQAIGSTGLQMNDQHNTDLDAVINKYVDMIIAAQ